MSVSIAQGVVAVAPKRIVAGTVAITGPSVICLAAGPLTGTATVGATIAAAINWKEVV